MKSGAGVGDDEAAVAGAAAALTRELFPIGHYVDDRKLMLQHVFASVPRGQIQAMLPPILKVIDFSQV